MSLQDHMMGRDWCADCGRRADNFSVRDAIKTPLCAACLTARDEYDQAADDARRLTHNVDSGRQEDSLA